MLGTTLGITYNSVAKTLSRVKDDGYSATYYLDDGTERFTLVVKHTIPARGVAGESHMVRLDVEHYDANGEYLRTSSAWTVIKTFDAVQDSDDSGYAVDSLVDLLAPTLTAQVIARES